MPASARKSKKSKKARTKKKSKKAKQAPVVEEKKAPKKRAPRIEEPPFSCHVRLTKGVVQVKVTLHRISPKCMKFEPTETEFYLDTFKSTKKFLLKFAYPHNIRVSTQPEPEATLEYGILSTELKITDFGDLSDKRSESLVKYGKKGVHTPAFVSAPQEQEQAPAPQEKKKNKKKKKKQQQQPEEEEEEEQEEEEEEQEEQEEEVKVEEKKVTKKRKRNKRKRAAEPSAPKNVAYTDRKSALAIIESVAAQVAETTGAHTDREAKRAETIRLKKEKVAARKQKNKQTKDSAMKSAKAQLSAAKKKRKNDAREEKERQAKKKVKFSV